MIHIREATHADLTTIRQLEEELFGQHAYPLFVLRQLFDITQPLFLIAEADGAVAGYAIGSLNTEKAEGWLLSLAVRPAFRGNRIGEKLTAAVTTALASFGARTILLTVHPDNHPALKIYRNTGFYERQLHPDYYLDGSPRLLLTKEL